MTVQDLDGSVEGRVVVDDRREWNASTLGQQFAGRGLQRYYLGIVRVVPCRHRLIIVRTTDDRSLAARADRRLDSDRGTRPRARVSCVVRRSTPNQR